MKNSLAVPNTFLCGELRYMMDIEAVFDHWPIVGYLERSPAAVERNGKPLYRLENLKPKSDCRVVICGERDHPAEAILLANGWKLGDNCFYAEEFFYSLDPSPVDFTSVPVAIWGTGDSARELLTMYAENWGELDIAFFIENDAHKANTGFMGYPVRYSADFTARDLRQQFILVASSFYADIKVQLQTLGLREFEHFMHFSHAVMRPSAMLRKVVTAQPVPGPECPYVFGGNLSFCMHGVFPCICARFLRLGIGNLLVQTPEEIWHSNAAKIFRLSIINHTYCFCHLERCGLPRQPARLAWSAEDVQPRKVERVEFAFDDTCNLYCPSCRESRHVLSAGHRTLRERMADSLLTSPLVREAPAVLACGGGEVFASPTYLRLVCGPEAPVRDSMLIQSNVQLFNNDTWKKLQAHARHMGFRCSIDGASKEVYEALRRGASFDTLCKNMETLAELRLSNQLEWLEIVTVVQRANYREIPAMVAFAKHYHCDCINFVRIMNWGTYTDAEFQEHVSMFETDNITMKKELKDIIAGININDTEIRIHIATKPIDRQKDPMPMRL